VPVSFFSGILEWDTVADGGVPCFAGNVLSAADNVNIPK
jgi:hypothetical protein